MSTAIEWTDATWNPVTGCTKVSQGCKHCYAERLAPKVFAGQKMRTIYVEIPAGLDRPRVFTDVLTHPERLEAPLHWKKSRRVFVNSMSDLFHEDVPDAFIDQVFAVMCKCCPRFDEQTLYAHQFQILTKRAARMREYMTDAKRTERVFEACDKTPLCGRSSPPPWPLPNVWLGVSVEDQATADERIPLLLQTPAAVRFLSCEPLLGRVDLCETFGMWWNATMKCFESTSQKFNTRGREGQARPGVDWVIAGGESGPDARPSHPAWFRGLRDQCAAARVPFFFKQWGQFIPEACAPRDQTGAHTGLTLGRKGVKVNGDLYWSVGKKAAGRTLDGRIHDEYPA